MDRGDKRKTRKGAPIARGSLNNNKKTMKKSKIPNGFELMSTEQLYHYFHTAIIPSYALSYKEGSLELMKIYNDEHRHLSFETDSNWCVLKTDSNKIHFYATYRNIEEIANFSTNFFLYNPKAYKTKKYDNKSRFPKGALSEWIDSEEIKEEIKVPILNEWKRGFRNYVLIKYNDKYKVLFFETLSDANLFVQDPLNQENRIVADFEITEEDYQAIPRINEAPLFIIQDGEFNLVGIGKQYSIYKNENDHTNVAIVE